MQIKVFIAIVLIGLALGPILGSSRESKRVIRQAQTNNASANEIASQQENEISSAAAEPRIHLVEPYKSMVETATRFALAQTKLSNHVSIDFSVHILKEVGFKLSKISNLVKLIKYVAISAVSILVTSFFFPGLAKFFDSMWNDPVNTLNLDRYLTNGLSERSVIGILGSKTDSMLKQVGLSEFSCRQRSICYFGEVLRCSSPRTAEALIKFGSDHFANTSLSSNPTVKSFLSGYVDRNCTSIPLETDKSEYCFRNLFNSFLGPATTTTNKQDKN